MRISRIVQHLNLQKLVRIIDVAGLFDQPLHNIALVIKRQLDGDAGKPIKPLGRRG